MRYLLTILFALAAAIEMAAFTNWYEPPVTMAPELTIIDSPSGPITTATVHVRMSVPDDKKAEWGIMWNYKDASNYVRATLIIPTKGPYDDLLISPAIVTVEHVSGGVSKVLYKRDMRDGIDLDGGFNSLKLVYDGSAAILYVGASDAIEIGKVPFSATGLPIAMFSDAKGLCECIQSTYTTTAAPAYSRFTDEAALMAHIKASADPLVGVWEYMDRKMDKTKAALGGKYTVAVVRNGDDYDIVYIDGADTYRSNWLPMMLKGRLTPTIFTGNYDMEWYDAHGALLDDELSAQLSDDHAILTLSFPLLDTQVRLRRVVKP